AFLSAPSADSAASLLHPSIGGHDARRQWLDLHRGGTLDRGDRRARHSVRGGAQRRSAPVRMPMAKKILVPVFPSEWFYDAVIRAADVVSHEGGLITFAFCRVRPPENLYADDPDGRPDELDVSTNAGNFDGKDLE